MNKKVLKIIKELSELNGISGYEKDVVMYVYNKVKDFATNIYFDNLGSLIIEFITDINKPKVMFAAHADEVGFLVNNVLDNGMLRLNPIGGWWNHVLLAQEMTVVTKNGKSYVGVIGAEPPHGLTKETKNKVLNNSDLYLDLGVKDKNQLLSLGVQIGDPVIPLTKFRVLNDQKTLLGKAFDNRISVAVLIELLKKLKNNYILANVVMVLTTQEEVGCRGAKTSTYAIKPDIGFAIDVTESYDTPNAESYDTKLGTGPALALMDGASISHRGLFDYVEKIAIDNKIPHTYDCCVFGGTDSSEIHKSFEGVINMTLSLPCRYFHSHTSLINVDDFDNTLKLLYHFIKKIDKEDLKTIRQSKYE